MVCCEWVCHHPFYSSISDLCIIQSIPWGTVFDDYNKNEYARLQKQYIERTISQQQAGNKITGVEQHSAFKAILKIHMAT